jgi:hypothetical protein
MVIYSFTYGRQLYDILTGHRPTVNPVLTCTSRLPTIDEGGVGYGFNFLKNNYKNGVILINFMRFSKAYVV